MGGARAGPRGVLATVLVAAGIVGAAVACSPPSPPAADRTGRSGTAPATASASSAPHETSTPPPALDPVSLPALMTRTYDGRELRTRSVLARTSAYTRYAVTYLSGTLRVSGVMNVPRGRGPFPVLVLLHGYIDPGVYVTGQGLMREQDYLARHGFVALHIDYRGHAGSDPAPHEDERLRLGYTVDAVNAVHAVRASSLPSLDASRVGLVGRSMGGGVLLNVLVTQPGLVDAAVAFAPVSSDAVDNFDRWIRGEPERRGLADRIVALHGSPEHNPAFWRAVSPRTYVDLVTEPLLVHHGTSDDSCPLRWSRTTVHALRAAGKDVRLFVYPGEGHAFGPQWPLAMRRTVHFLDRQLGG